MPIVTTHAQKRTKERVGLPKSAAKRNADRAFSDGIRRGETSGSLRRYLDMLYFRKETANQLRVYCGNVYIFCHGKLVTVIPLPAKYRATEKRIREGRANNGAAD